MAIQIKTTTLFIQGSTNENWINNLPLYSNGHLSVNSGINLYIEGGLGTVARTGLNLITWGGLPASSNLTLYTVGPVASTGQLSLYTLGPLPLDDSLYLYIKVDPDVSKSLDLFVCGPNGTGINRSLKLYTTNSDGITDGASIYSSSMTLYIHRTTEAVDGFTPLYVKAVEGEPNSYLYLYTSGSPTSLINNNMSLYLSNLFGSGYNNINLYTHGF